MGTYQIRRVVFLQMHRIWEILTIRCSGPPSEVAEPAAGNRLSSFHTDTLSMLKVHTFVTVLIVLSNPVPLKAAANVYKCTANGLVTYQSGPCPSGESRKQPTVEQLNAERHKRLQQAADATSSSGQTNDGQPRIGRPATAGSSVPENLGRPVSATTAREPLTTSFKCDGRTHCSQMTSCAESRYFLAHCPGVKMDGDGNGIPCERQWCSK